MMQETYDDKGAGAMKGMVPSAMLKGDTYTHTHTHRYMRVMLESLDYQ